MAVSSFNRRQWASQSLRVTAKELSIVGPRGKNTAIAERFSKYVLCAYLVLHSRACTSSRFLFNRFLFILLRNMLLFSLTSLQFVLVSIRPLCTDLFISTKDGSSVLHLVIRYHFQSKHSFKRPCIVEDQHNLRLLFFFYKEMFI